MQAFDRGHTHEVPRLRLAALLQVVTATQARLQRQPLSASTSTLSPSGAPASPASPGLGVGAAAANIREDGAMGLPLDALTRKLEKRVREVLLAALEAQQDARDAQNKAALLETANANRGASSSPFTHTYTPPYLSPSSAAQHASPSRHLSPPRRTPPAGTPTAPIPSGVWTPSYITTNPSATTPPVGGGGGAADQHVQYSRLGQRTQELQREMLNMQVGGRAPAGVQPSRCRAQGLSDCT